MTNEERQIISQFIARVGGAPQPSFGAGGSVPGGSVPTTQPALPPIDREADEFIGQAFTQNPEARYRITQLAFVQEHALVEAQNRIQRLQWELQQAQQATQQAQQFGQRSGGGGFFSSLFGGGNRAQPQGDPRWGGPGGGGQGGGPQGAPGYPGGQQQPNYQQSAPPPQYPPNYQQGMFQQRGGSGFLGSALTTAAGVAGGMVAGNALMNLFSPHSGLGGGFGAGGLGGEAAASPWANPAASAQDYVDNGTWDQSGAAAPDNQASNDGGSWDQSSQGNDPSWTDNTGGGSDGGGWDNTGGGGDSGGWDNTGGGGGDGGWDSGGGGSDDTF
ncbi:DUF2076 domain-containing protein [Rhodopila sp.]|uniref:DUF2076 domain-containing protein n=1 Tax=Rhodopila sp. TaxID=2480087 RepID=UPI003D0A180B